MPWAAWQFTSMSRFGLAKPPTRPPRTCIFICQRTRPARCRCCCISCSFPIRPFPTRPQTRLSPALFRRPGFSEGGPVTNIFAHGYGYATFRYSDIQPDNSNTFHSGVIGLTLKPGQAKPAPDEWGTISAWAWGASRVLDYLEKDRSVDAKRVALIGHSRLGKTVLLAGARDPRFAIIYSSCAR